MLWRQNTENEQIKDKGMWRWTRVEQWLRTVTRQAGELGSQVA